jgi:FKBP-type peptidyl-prolyl cis-trans isomerase 2
MKINKGDFIELDYTAKILGENVIFDTTIVEDATKAGLLHDHEDNHEHGHKHNHLHKEDLKPIIICVGEKQVLPALDAKIEGLDLGKHIIPLSEEEAFGKKDTKLLKLMPISLFKKENIRPFVGLPLDIDGTRGVVRSISGGRVIVDFNHQLAGKKIEYSLNIKRLVTENKEKVESVLKMLRFPYTNVNVEGKSAKVNAGVELPKEILESLSKNLSTMTALEVEIISAKPKAQKSELKADTEKENAENEKSDLDAKLEEKEK